MGRILIIEDDALLAMEMARALTLAGHITDTAGSIKEATARLFGQAVDLIISDFDLPDGKGIQICWQPVVRREKTPVIICSGGATEELEQARKLNAVRAVFQKPAAIDKIIGCVNELTTGCHDVLHPRLISREERQSLLHSLSIESATG